MIILRSQATVQWNILIGMIIKMPKLALSKFFVPKEQIISTLFVL